MEQAIFEALSGARIVEVDCTSGLFLAWWGGHGIHAYDITGQEVSFWNVEAGGETSADHRTIRASMRRAIRTGDYPDC